MTARRLENRPLKDIPLRVLVIEDSEDDAALVVRELRLGGFAVTWERVDSAPAMKQALDSKPWDVIIADYSMPQFNAPAALSLLKESEIDLPFIVVSGAVGEEVAVEMMKTGAHDYLMKDNLARLVPAVGRELRDAEVRRARRQAEEALQRHVEELSRSNAELEQFAYVASHDLQEPLRMVISYCNLIRERYSGRLDRDADDFINFAVDGAERMSRLVKDLLAYSRASNRPQLVEPVNCEHALDKALANLAEAIRESGAVVTRDTLPTIASDASLMQQLFQNLVGNAIKFRGKAAPAVHVSATRSGREWLFSVSDNGIGFDSRYTDRIFGVFQRLHKSKDYPGSGIGLAICKRIVERHGGRIWCESEAAKGSTFYFTLPEREEVTTVAERSIAGRDSAGGG